MTVISKELFYERVGRDVSCDIIHFWKANCLDVSLTPFWLLNMVKGTAIFFLPIYIMKFLLRYKKKTLKTNLLSLLKSELRTIVYGVAMGSILISTICVLRQVFGRIHYYNLLLIPGFASALSILIETEENQVLDTIIFFNAFIETQLRKMRLDRLKETVLFMCVSGALMQLLERRSTQEMGFTHFWFYVPRKKIEEEEKSLNCNDCDNPLYDLFKDFMKYFSLGYGINVIRKLLPKFGLILRKPSELLTVLVNKSNVYFGLFIGSYVTIYRVLSSIFTKNSIIDKRYHGFLAGLLAGVSYNISPNLQVLVIAITTLLQMIYEYVCQKMKITNHYWQRFLLYSVTHGIMLHNKFFYPDTCSPYYKNMIDACTNHVTKQMYKNLVSRFFT